MSVRMRQVSKYRDEDQIVVRRCAYGDVAIHQQGRGRSVYLTDRQARGFALRLLVESFRAPRLARSKVVSRAWESLCGWRGHRLTAYGGPNENCLNCGAWVEVGEDESAVR